MLDKPIRIYCECSTYQIKTVYMILLKIPSGITYRCNGCDDACGCPECKLCRSAMDRIFLNKPDFQSIEPFLPSAEAPPQG